MNRHALADRLSRAPSIASKPWWPALRRAMATVFLVAVGALLFMQARRIEWNEVMRILAGYPLSTLAMASGTAALSHAIYSGYDLLGRAWTAHRLAAWKVMAVTFVSYAFNLNFGTLVGGVGFRLRLYSRLGLSVPVISRVLGLSLATNWLGYFATAGAVFALGVVLPPPGWEIGSAALRTLGAAMLMAALAYLAICAGATTREWTILGHDISLPPLKLAAMQLAVSCANWTVIAAVVFILMRGRIDYPTALGVLLAGALAGAIAHIPAGLGVLEAVFIALLAPPLSHSEVLAALLAYRAIYYLVPLLAACGVYFLLELLARRGAAATV